MSTYYRVTVPVEGRDGKTRFRPVGVMFPQRDGARSAFERSSANLDLGPVDLYLIHAPWPWDAIGTDHREGNIAVWRVFEEVHGDGRARSIGVSNFSSSALESLTGATDVVPHVNQIRYHVGHTDPDATGWSQSHGVLVESLAQRWKEGEWQHHSRFAVDLDHLLVRVSSTSCTLLTGALGPRAAK